MVSDNTDKLKSNAYTEFLFCIGLFMLLLVLNRLVEKNPGKMALPQFCVENGIVILERIMI